MIARISDALPMILPFLAAFLCGGILCVLGQILIDKTKFSPARILVVYVVAGVVLGGIGVYSKFAELAGAGATVPLTGFGWTLSKGVSRAMAESGLLGIFTGGLTAAAGGIASAIFFGFLIALVCKPKSK
jgi:stage V sporulation protein AE